MNLEKFIENTINFLEKADLEEEEKYNLDNYKKEYENREIDEKEFFAKLQELVMIYSGKLQIKELKNK